MVGKERGMTSEDPAHRTLSLHEWHVIGPAGLPVRHRTVHVLRALRPELAAFTYRYDSSDARVTVLRGARAGEPRPDDDGLTAVVLTFPRPLAVGQTASLEYETVFTWRAVPRPEVRRAMRQRVERLDMRVEVSPDRLPAEVRWAVWDGFGPEGRVRAAERVELDAEHAVHRFVDAAEGVTVGFEWGWPPGREPVLPG
jgi:hypothetical protein